MEGALEGAYLSTENSQCGLYINKKKKPLMSGTSLVVQELELPIPKAGGRVQSLAGELEPKCYN